MVASMREGCEEPVSTGFGKCVKIVEAVALILFRLCALPLAGLGAFIGVSFHTPEEAVSIDRLLIVMS